MLISEVLTPAEAIVYFQQKGLQTSFAWEDVSAEMHKTAFTVAKVMQMDIVDDFQKAVEQALAEGKSLEEFRKEIEPTLVQKGWWGKKDMEDPHTGEIREVQLGSPHRLKIIYNTNLANAHSEGQWARIQDRKESHPYLEYDANNSEHSRIEHSAWDGLVFRVDDPWVIRHFPKKEFECKCRMRSLSKLMLKRSGKTVEDGAEHTFELDSNGKVVRVPEKYREVYNNRTGQTQKVAKGVHPAFNFPTGQGWYDNLAKHAEGKLDQLPPALQKAIGKVVALDIPPLVKPPVVAAPVVAQDEFDDLLAIPDSQMGSMPGGLYISSDGSQYYVKFYPNEEHARMEYASNLIYRELGIPVPDLKIGKVTAPDGNKKLALVSRWETGLEKLTPEEMAEHKEELSRIFASSVLLKNWDVIGLGYDNLLMKNGKLVLVDTGASFKFRAQGALKEFAKDNIDEVNTFLDPKINPQSARVFGKVFEDDVWLEQSGAKSLLKLKDKRVEELLKMSGLDEKTVQELVEGVKGRKKLLIDRYNLRGKYTPKGFGKHLTEFKKWESKRFSRQTAPNGAVYSKAAETEVLDLVQKFEDYVTQNIHPNAKPALQQIFLDWSTNSSNPLSSLIKKWSEDRFGTRTNFHLGELDVDLLSAQNHLSSQLGIDLDTAFKLLDAEYEFHQYYLKRLHGWDKFVVERGMSEGEYRATYKRGSYQFNSVASTQTKPQGAFKAASRRLRFNVRTEEVLKTWYQGSSYLAYYKSELEYVVIGGKKAAKDIS